VDKGSAVPYYHQVKEAIKAMIVTGELKSGDMLPSEFNLSDQLGSAAWSFIVPIANWSAMDC